MDKKEQLLQENITAYIHDNMSGDDFESDKAIEIHAYKESRRIEELSNHVTFLRNLDTSDKAWSKFKSTIKPKIRSLEFLKFAAAIVLSFLIGALMLYFVSNRNFNEEMASINCPRGQITSMSLFDGTTVWLNSETKLRYSSNFNNGNREVFVEGEAYFDVAKNPHSTFIVNVGNSQIKVHGTIFNVKAYPIDSLIETTLVEGTVEFVDGKNSVLLKPNEQLTLENRTRKLEKEHVDVSETLGWKEGKVYFENKRMSKIIEQLERWYDAEFIFNEEEIAGYNFTGVINKEKSIVYNLKLIQLTNKINFKYKDGKIYIGK